MQQKTQLKSRLRRLVSWASLVLILLLTGFSLFGTFIGAEAAKRLFNSIPLAFYWLALTALLVTAFVIFPRLLRIRGLFLIHIGCVLVLAGGLWGSQACLKIQDALMGTNTIHSGQMKIYEGETQKEVETENGGKKELPFAIKLTDFRIDYYEPGQLLIQTTQGEGFKIPAEPGRELNLGDDLGGVEIVRKFESFKLILEGGKRLAIDDPNGGFNPALELRLKNPDANQTTKYVFERFQGHTNPDDKLRFFYIRPIRDFISDLEVIKDDKVLIRKSIEVNKPLSFGGYIFYQQGYDNEAGRYTVLRVTSDKGLIPVYLGYIMLCAGAFWHLWLRHIFGDREIED